MQLVTYIPKGFLKEFVSAIVYLSGAGTGVAFQRMYQVIIINIGHHFTVSDVYTTGPQQEHTDTIWINGKQENTLMIGNSGLTAMYVIGLRSGMLPYLANLPAITTNNLAVGAEHWTSREIFNLREQLLACRDIQSGFLLIEKYLTGLLQKKDLSNLEKVKWLGKAIPTTRVTDICHALGVTRKQLRSETQYYFGGSAKNLQGIIRFNHMLAAMPKIAAGRCLPCIRITTRRILSMTLKPVQVLRLYNLNGFARCTRLFSKRLIFYLYSRKHFYNLLPAVRNNFAQNL